MKNKTNGISIVLLVSVFIMLVSCGRHKLSYDKYNENAKQIYRLAFKEDRGYKIVNFPITPCTVAPTMVKEFPEAINAVRFRRVFP